MRLLEALRLVSEGKAIVVIRNPIRRGQKPIEVILL